MKILSTLISVLLLNLAIAPSAFASGSTEKEAKFAEKVKTGIAKLGTGSEAKVKLKLKDGTKLEGYVTEIGSDQFVVMNSKTGQAVPVPYPHVKQVKGNNLSTGAFILITIGVIIAIGAILVAIYNAQGGG